MKRRLLGLLAPALWAVTQAAGAGQEPGADGAEQAAVSDEASSRALAVRGLEVFQANCAHCHGARGDGVSRVARVLQPAPSNLRASTLSHDEMRRMVELGGAAAFGRSSSMPAWGPQLPPEDLEAVVTYVFGLRHEEAF